jgi:hypothetical protein
MHGVFVCPALHVTGRSVRARMDTVGPRAGTGASPASTTAAGGAAEEAAGGAEGAEAVDGAASVGGPKVGGPSVPPGAPQATSTQAIHADFILLGA